MFGGKKAETDDEPDKVPAEEKGPQDGTPKLGKLSRTSLSRPTHMTAKEHVKVTEPDAESTKNKQLKLRCTCDKDEAYSFACKHGIIWFAQHVLIMKIRRLQK